MCQLQIMFAEGRKIKLTCLTKYCKGLVEVKSTELVGTFLIVKNGYTLFNSADKDVTCTLCSEECHVELDVTATVTAGSTGSKFINRLVLK